MKLLAITLILTAFVCVVWLVFSAALVGWGLLLRRAYRAPPAPNADALFDGFFTGYALVILFALLVNFVWPIDGVVLAFVLALGFVSCWWNRHTIREALAGELAVHRWPVALGIGVLVVWAANHTLGPIAFYDSGMYHVGAVEWANRFAVVPGLGNLHDRYAFNSASLLVAALLDAGPLDGLSSHLSNGLLLVVLGIYGIVAASRFRRGDAHRISNLLAFVLLPLAALTFLGKEPRSLSTDPPVTMLVAAAALLLVRNLERPSPEPRERSYALACMLLLLAAAVTAKLSAIPFAATTIPIALLAARARDGGFRWKSIGAALALPVLMGVAWVARGVVLSGYPAYPLTIGGLPVAWRLPAEQGKASAAWIATSARALDDGRWELNALTFGRWVSNVLHRDDLFVDIPLALIITACALVAALVIGRFRALGNGPRVWLLWIPVLGSIVFWANSAPHPRFAVSYFWLAAGLSVAMLHRALVRRGTAAERSGNLALPTLAVLLTVCFVAGTFISRVRRTDIGFAARIEPAFMLIWWDGFRNASKQPDLVTFRTSSGLVLPVPRETNQCWRAELLCTPHPAENLRLRRPGDLSAGFRVDGPWDPRRWPNPMSPFLSYWRCVHRPAAPDNEPYEQQCMREAKKDSIVTRLP